jgi:hypothetical protein
VLLASGDVHFAEISRAICRRVTPRTAQQNAAHGTGGSETSEVGEGEVRELWEVTSSGMTHAWGTHALVARVAIWLVMATMPYNYQQYLYTGLNFAQLDFFPAQVATVETQGAQGEGEGGAGGDAGGVVIKVVGVEGNEPYQRRINLHHPTSPGPTRARAQTQAGREGEGGGGEEGGWVWECEAPSGRPEWYHVWAANGLCITVLILMPLLFVLRVFVAFMAWTYNLFFVKAFAQSKGYSQTPHFRETPYDTSNSQK